MSVCLKCFTEHIMTRSHLNTNSELSGLLLVVWGVSGRWVCTSEQCKISNQSECEAVLDESIRALSKKTRL